VVGEFSRTVLSYFVVGLAGGVLGGFVVWLLGCRTLERSGAQPADVFDGYHPDGPGEATVEVRTDHPESAAVEAELAAEPEPVTASLPKDFGTGMWPVSETQRLDPVGGETVQIRKGRLGYDVKPWRWQAQHRGPESLAERAEPLFLAGKPFETTKDPRLDWSSRTGELDEVSG
jgi:hypothetical protein